jgi:hypothetical protein
MINFIKATFLAFSRERLPANSVSRPGQALVIATLVFTVLMGLAALAVDIGNIWLQYRKLRNIADAATLVGAQGYQVVDGSWPLSTAGIQAARDYLTNYGGIPCGPPDTAECQVVSPVTTYGGEGDQYIQITLSRDVPFYFARILGFSSQRLTVTSTARTNRPQPSDFAVIALGTGANGDVQIEQAGGSAAGGNYRITGSHLASWSGITQFGGSAGTIFTVNGQSFVDVAGVVTARVNPLPIRQANMADIAPDPFSGVVWPALSNDCNIGPPNESPPLNPRHVYKGSVTVGAGETVIFHPGTYCTITITGGTSRFLDGNYRITGVFNAAPSTETIMNMASCPSGDPTCLTNTEGIYFQIDGSLSFRDKLRFQLRGRKTDGLKDVLFRLTGTTGSISITNELRSNALGSIYAPQGSIIVRGNACNDNDPPRPNCGVPSSRVTRGRGTSGVSITQRGGQVVGQRVRLILDRSTYESAQWLDDSWGIDYPPNNNNRQPVPNLVPNSP